jgi:hypothetical protein
MKNKNKIIIALFILMCALTDIAYLGNIDILKWIDIPTHFTGGMLVAVLLSLTKLKRRPVLASILIITMGVGWEVIELVLSHSFPEPFTELLFRESLENRIQDLLVGFMGFVSAYKQ